MLNTLRPDGRSLSQKGSFGGFSGAMSRYSCRSARSECIDAQGDTGLRFACSFLKRISKRRGCGRLEIRIMINV